MRKSLRAVAAVATIGTAIAVAGPALAATPTTVKVTTTSGLKFTGMPSTLKAGTYKFAYTNSSGVDHNLKVGTVSTPTFAKGTKTITVTLKKGTVKYECTVPGHAMAGMKGTIKVS